MFTHVQVHGTVQLDTPVQVNSKVWLEDGEGRYLFGFGVAEILEGIDQHGSITAVAREMGRSYRYVWGRIRKAERVLGFALIDTTQGGRSAKRSSLTNEGRRWMNGFLKLRAAVKRTAESHYAKHLEGL